MFNSRKRCVFAIMSELCLESQRYSLTRLETYLGYAYHHLKEGKKSVEQIEVLLTFHLTIEIGIDECIDAVARVSFVGSPKFN